jgi:hypothetical protein
MLITKVFPAPANTVSRKYAQQLLKKKTYRLQKSLIMFLRVSATQSQEGELLPQPGQGQQQEQGQG